MKPVKRKVFIYKKTRITMDKLKKGDIYSLEGTVDDKEANPNEVFIATSNAKPNPKMGKGFNMVWGTPIVILGAKVKTKPQFAIDELRKAIRKNEAEYKRVRKDPTLKKSWCEVMVRTTMTNGGLRRAIAVLKAVK